MDKLYLNKLYLNIEMDRKQDVQPPPNILWNFL